MLPGAGQFYLREERWVPYVALEAWAWISYANQKSRGRSLQRRYRDLACVARRISGCQRRDTVFSYYEAMADPSNHESGDFDSDEQVGGLQPERDTTTYNGRVWQRARSFFLPDGFEFPTAPGYPAALAYYQANAIPPGYLWSWGDSDLEQESFIRLIDDSDDALRVAKRTLGLILANHVVSAIDALVTGRLQSVARGSQRLQIGSELAPAGGSVHWTTTFRYTVGNK